MDTMTLSPEAVRTAPRMAPATSRRALWTGRVLSALAVLFLLMDAVMKVMQAAPVLDSFRQLGYPTGVALGIGLLELACIAAYVVPRTSVLGAVLLTGYLGGAVATHVRIGSPLATHTLFPLYVGALVWGGLLLRDRRLRALFPVRRADG